MDGLGDEDAVSFMRARRRCRTPLAVHAPPHELHGHYSVAPADLDAARRARYSDAPDDD
jgi:hypothetical protein